jgi:hypothetical protein
MTTKKETLAKDGAVDCHFASGMWVRLQLLDAAGAERLEVETTLNGDGLVTSLILCRVVVVDAPYAEPA